MNQQVNTRTTKSLEVLRDTDYWVNVVRDITGGYEVEVFKPADTDDPYVTEELVSSRYLPGTSGIDDLERAVAAIIDQDHPSLVGQYTYFEESNVS